MGLSKKQQHEQPTATELWRRAGVDFDQGGKSSLADLLRLGGFFPLSKVEDRLPLSRNCLYQWSRGVGDPCLTRCFVPIRGRAGGCALTILVDLVRLIDTLNAQFQARILGLSGATPAAPTAPCKDLP